MALMLTLIRRILVLACVWRIVGGLAVADEPHSFVEVIQPLLETKCIACHGREKQEGGLRLDSFAGAKSGGDSGPAIVPGDVGKSLFVKAISFRDPVLQMPPKQRLTDREIAALTKWVEAGADWPEPVVGCTPGPMNRSACSVWPTQ